MMGGRIEQIGSPQDIYQTPSSPWIASFVGDVNLIAGTAAGDEAVTVIGSVPLAAGADGFLEVLVRPEDLSLTAGGPGTVALTEYYGHDMMVTVEIEGAQVLVRAPARAPWSRGDSVSLTYVGEGAKAFT